ncbi:hypothetical protein Tco_1292369 [Tanacetum coccineum]
MIIRKQRLAADGDQENVGKAGGSRSCIREERQRQAPKFGSQNTAVGIRRPKNNAGGVRRSGDVWRGSDVLGEAWR